MTYLFLFSIGLGTVWLGRRLKDEINLITAAVIGAIFLVWGFALAPSSLQMLVEILLVIALFPICMRCMDCDLSRKSK